MDSLSPPESARIAEYLIKHDYSAPDYRVEWSESREECGGVRVEWSGVRAERSGVECSEVG